MLPGFWFGIICILWAGFFLLEGFDFGVGILLPFVGRTETDRQVAYRAIGPTWDGNEVWLLTAGGATFAAFPSWYASLFAGLYIPLALVLVGLILRGICIEYRGKVATDEGRAWCDRGMFVGSLLPALLLGVAFADLIRGMKLDSSHQIVGNFWDLVTPFGLLGGLAGLVFFMFHGAVFLSLRTEGPVRDRAHRAAALLTAPMIVLGAGFFVWSIAFRHNAVSIIVAVAVALTLVASAAAIRRGREAWSFIASAVVALGLPIFVFASLWPNVIPARNHAAWSLTVHNASSSHYTLQVMTVVALIMTPIVLAYQAWTYWVFRARVSDRTVASGLTFRPAVSANEAYAVTAPEAPADVAGDGDGAEDTSATPSA